MKWEMIAGLEVHVELSTASKIFCACATAFGGQPNTRVCPVCAGMPGTLPVLNRKVVEFAVRAGLALGCRVNRASAFDRKNYFYPDLPKAYQITQLYLPICQSGTLEIETESGSKAIGIREIHMEEDAGKLIHRPEENCTLVDLNRCGVPLLEIVSEPDFRSAEEVVAYLEKLRETLLFLGISDCKMQEGSMRADINLSVRPRGSGELGPRTEMKNMNSFRHIRRAVEYETARQIELLEGGGTVVQETRRWNVAGGCSHPMRQKEDARDYHYFPEPDLPPVVLDDAWVEGIHAALPELPEAKRARYRSRYGLPAHDAALLTSARELADLFERTAQLSGEPKEAANLIMGDVMRLMGEDGIPPEELTLDPAKLADLIRLVKEGSITRSTAKEVLEHMFREGADPLAYVESRGLRIHGDPTLIEQAVTAALAENPKSVDDYRSGKEKALTFLMGQVMRKLGSRADPQKVSAALREHLNG